MRYAIGKSTRHEPFEIVMSVPFTLNEVPPKNRYEVLRSTVYATQTEAEAAANEAAQYNPVGFVVIRIGTKREVLEDCIKRTQALIQRSVDENWPEGAEPLKAKLSEWQSQLEAEDKH